MPLAIERHMWLKQFRRAFDAGHVGKSNIGARRQHAHARPAPSDKAGRVDGRAIGEAAAAPFGSVMKPANNAAVFMRASSASSSLCKLDQPRCNRGQPGDAAHLARHAALEHVADIVGRHAHRRADHGRRQVGRVGQNVVGDAAAVAVEFDAGDDAPAAGKLAIKRRVDLLGRKLAQAKLAALDGDKLDERFAGASPARARRALSTPIRSAAPSISARS